MNRSIPRGVSESFYQIVGLQDFKKGENERLPQIQINPYKGSFNKHHNGAYLVSVHYELTNIKTLSYMIVVWL